MIDSIFVRLDRELVASVGIDESIGRFDRFREWDQLVDLIILMNQHRPIQRFKLRVGLVGALFDRFIRSIGDFGWVV